MTVLDEVPASIGQRLVWFLEHYRSGTSSVSCPAVFRIRGGFDERRLPAALAALVGRHESLRTTLHRRGRALVQRVHDHAATACQVVELAAGAEPELDRQLGAELASAIPVDQSPVRFTLWRLGDDDRVLCANMHHLVSDAWSCAVVIEDLIGLLSGPPVPQLRPVGWQYRQYVRWQQRAAGDGTLRAHHDYWQAKLADLVLPLLPDRAGDGAAPRPALATAVLPGATGERLRGFARAERTTLFSVCLALYYLLLHRETGQTDLAVGSLFANRGRRELRHTVGLLANLLALRTTVDPDGPFRRLVGDTRRTVLDAVVHQAVPSQLLASASLLRTPRRLDDVVFQMLPDRSPESWDPTPLAPGVQIDTFRPPRALSRFGLNLTVIPRHDRLDARLSYADNQFPPGWARRFLDGYARLAEAVLAQPDRPLAGLLAGEW